MKKIQFNKKDYDIPTDWSEITLRKQMEVSQIASEQKYVKTLGILAGYTGIDIQELKTAKVGDLERVMKHMVFMQEPIPEEPIMTFHFNGHDYVVPPNILEQQFQDYVSIQTAIAEYKDNQWMVTPYILAVMCKRNQGEETLDDFKINERAEEFKDIPVTIANGIAGFFLSNTKVYKSTLMLSTPEVLQEAVHAKFNELRLSAKQLRKQRGGNLLIRLWTMILLKWTKSLERQWEKSFNSHQSKSSKKKWKLIYKLSQWKMRRRKSKN